MKNSNKYRIVKNEYHDEYGVLQSFHYNVQVLKTILFFWSGWFTIKHQECGWGDCINTPTKFKTIGAAESFIQNILCVGGTYDGWSSHTFEECGCNKKN